jgi:hypothetical protein
VKAFALLASENRMIHGSHDCLTAVINIYISDYHLLAARSAMTVQGFHLRRERTQQLVARFTLATVTSKAWPGFIALAMDAIARW